MAPKLTDGQADQVTLLYSSGVSARAVARQLGISRYHVLQLLKEASVEVRTDKHPELYTVSHARWDELYWGSESGYPSLSALGRYFGCTDQVIRQHLTAAGIRVRSRSEQQRLEIRIRGKYRPAWGEESRRAAQEALRASEKRTVTEETRKKISQSRQSMDSRVTLPCAWCGAPVRRWPNQIARSDYTTCCRSHTNFHRHLRKQPPEYQVRPLILALFIERMAELRKQGLPIGAATMQKAAEPIGAGGIELEAYLVTLTPREMDEYLDNQLEHDVRAAGL